MLAQLASSNAVQLAATFVAGGLGYLLAVRWPAILAVAGFAAAALLAVSFVFDVGEVYSYSPLYKRAFWYLGDDVTTWLTPLLMWAILSKRRLVAMAVACAILFSGTKISLVLLALQFLAIVVISKGLRRELIADLVKPLLVAVAVYVPLVLASPYMMAAGNKAAATIVSTAEQPAAGTRPVAGAVVSNKQPVVASEPLFQPSRQGRGSCRTGDCLLTHLTRPLHDRSFSAVGGLWMMLQGGFPGERYPNTPEKFADLMLEANPWGINDTFGITRDEWIKMGTVQTPYLQFGAGYGPVSLAILLAAIAAIGVLGIKNVIAGERGPFVAFTIFFAVNAIFNQTQPWLTRGPILFVVGFCAAHILARYLSQRRPGATASEGPREHPGQGRETASPEREPAGEATVG